MMIDYEELKAIVYNATKKEIMIDDLIAIVVDQTEADSFESILNRMLARVPDDLDKSEGSMIYDALAPVAVELQLMSIKLHYDKKESFADTASRDGLVARAKERGVLPFSASKAQIKAEIAPAGLDITGKRFNAGELTYKALSMIDESHFMLECEIEGTEGNRASGKMIPIEFVNGLEKIEVKEILIPAKDEEETERFRGRYFSSFNSQAFGGNVQDYKEKTKALRGIGGVKVTPNWDGKGGVKLTILASNNDVPSSELLTQVKSAMDPDEFEGKGYGIAPINHVVTVEGVTALTINISTSITYQDGWSYEASKLFIEKAIDAYFLELTKSWESEEEIIVRISKLETAILNAQGVLDVQATTLNGASNNIILERMQIPKRGTLNG